MGLFGKHKQNLQSRASELTSAISASMPRWFDRLAERFPEIHEASMETWCYFTGIAATFFTVLVLQKQCTEREFDSAFDSVWNTLPRLLPENENAPSVLDRIQNENALMDDYRDCFEYFGLECPKLEKQGVAHDDIAPSVLGAWVAEQVKDAEGRKVASVDLSRTLGSVICIQLGDWWD